MPNATTKYIYDAEGRRVAKENSGTGAVTVSYVLSLGGDQLDEINGSGAWQHSNIFAMGKLYATYGAEQSQQTTRFHLTDWLGTRRIDLPPSGNATLSCFSYPYGDGLSCGGTDADITEQHFTGKQRDNETGDDDFGARYYSSNMGRFLTADEVRNDANPANPQSWNLYAYVHDNPMSLVDPNGEYSEAAMQQEELTNENMAGMNKEMEPYMDRYGSNMRLKPPSDSKFWAHIKRGLGNLLHGHSWNYETREVVTMTPLPESVRELEKSESDGVATAASDIGGLVATFGDAPKVGYLVSAASLSNDHHAPNWIFTGVGLVRGLEVPAAGIPAEADLFNWEIQEWADEASKSEAIKERQRDVELGQPPSAAEQEGDCPLNMCD